MSLDGYRCVPKIGFGEIENLNQYRNRLFYCHKGSRDNNTDDFITRGISVSVSVPVSVSVSVSRGSEVTHLLMHGFSRPRQHTY